MDRLSAYAARESESEPAENRRKMEEEAAIKLLGKLQISKETKDNAPRPAAADGVPESDTQTNGASSGETPPKNPVPDDPPRHGEEIEKNKEEDNPAAKKNRGIPQNVKLYEIFYDQVVNLVNAQNLPIQDTTALLVSLANMAL
jgi:vacuolar protein sorting-associated protein 35